MIYMYDVCNFLKYKILQPILSIPHLRLIDKRELNLVWNNFNALKSMINPSDIQPATGELRELQLRNLEFAKEIVTELEQQGIKIFLFAGSLLGAERHGGYIPWDDDIDFACLREDYEKVIEYAQKKYKVFCQNINKYNYGKTSIESRNNYLRKYPNEVLLLQFPFLKFIKGTCMEDSVCFDLFPLDYYSDNYSYQDHIKYCEKMRRLLWNLDNIKERVEYIKSERKNNPNIVERSNTISFGIDNPGSYIESQRTSWWTHEDFFPLKKMKFEDTEFNVPNNHIKVLDYWCKNWRGLPNDLTPEHMRERK